MQKILTIVGTRPEAIKMAPVVHALRRRPDACEVVLCSSGQHREMVGQALEVFDLAPDLTLDVMRPDQDLCGLTSRLFAGLGDTISEIRPDWVVAQGDTTTVMVSAVAAFYSQARFGHVEAGLRTGDLRHPFPEEMNRVFADRIADLNFAPTERARETLLAEGIAPEAIQLTGNTVVDAVNFVREEARLKRPQDLPGAVGGKRIVLVTAHRRESFGEGLRTIFSTIGSLADEFADFEFVFPVHPNPNVRNPAHEILGDHGNVHLIDPVGYTELGWLLDHAALVLTDSGGIQEEAPSYGVPTLVMRDTTERPEGIEAGVAQLVGRSGDRIARAARPLLRESRSLPAPANPYGDGRASERIADLLLCHRPDQ